MDRWQIRISLPRSDPVAIARARPFPIDSATAQSTLDRIVVNAIRLRIYKNLLGRSVTTQSMIKANRYGIRHVGWHAFTFFDHAWIAICQKPANGCLNSRHGI